MGIFKEDEENTILSEDMNMDDKELEALFQGADVVDGDELEDANVDKDLLSQIFSGETQEDEELDKELEAQFADMEEQEELGGEYEELLGHIESIEDAAKEAVEKENKKRNKKKKQDKTKEEPVQEQLPIEEMVEEPVPEEVDIPQQTDVTEAVKEEPAQETSVEDTKIEQDVTVISQGTTIEGGIASEGDMDVKGTIKGDITSKGKVSIDGTVTGSVTAAEIKVNTKRLEGTLHSEGQLEITEGTVVVGDIMAAGAYIAGAVKGNMDVNGAVVLDATSVVQGDIKAKSIQVNEGAILEGHCILSYSQVDMEKIFGTKNGLISPGNEDKNGKI